MLGKLKAAVAARRDPDFVIAGRTSALRVEGLEGAIERVRTYAAAGVDALFAIGLETEAEIRALREASGLPIIAGPSLKAGPHERPALAAAGVALPLQGHKPRSEEHTSELQSVMSISYAVFCLQTQKGRKNPTDKHAKRDTST